ncbi:hypothetical protein D3C72_2580030 [compost metagenome]
MSSKGRATRIAVMAARNSLMLPSSDQDASLPPRLLPTVKPTPTSTRPKVMKTGEAPVNVSSIGTT